jgi:NifU-like protein involved in Fe-S cluster formation
MYEERVKRETPGTHMSGDNDLIKLYSARILALAADIPHLDRLAAPDATVKKRSPLCGSTVTVDVVMEGGSVAEYGQDVKACALGQAAASVVGGAVIGTTRDQIETARDQLRAMLKSDGPVPDAPFDGLEVLLPAREFKNRHASILLALEATAEAIAHAEQANCA